MGRLGGRQFSILKTGGHLNLLYNVIVGLTARPIRTIYLCYLVSYLRLVLSPNLQRVIISYY